MEGEEGGQWLTSAAGSRLLAGPAPAALLFDAAAGFMVSRKPFIPGLVLPASLMYPPPLRPTPVRLALLPVTWCFGSGAAGEDAKDPREPSLPTGFLVPLEGVPAACREERERLDSKSEGKSNF